MRRVDRSNENVLMCIFCIECMYRIYLYTRGQAGVIWVVNVVHVTINFIVLFLHDNHTESQNFWQNYNHRLCAFFL